MRVGLVVDLTPALTHFHFEEGLVRASVLHPLRLSSPVPSNTGYRDSWGFERGRPPVTLAPNVDYYACTPIHSPPLCLLYEFATDLGH